MGSDLYMEEHRMEPAYNAASHFARIVKNKSFKLPDGTSVVKTKDLLEWLKDYDPMWMRYEKDTDGDKDS